MKLALDQLVLLGVFSAAIHWLVARSEIARPLWSRTTGFIDKLLRCASCSGFWIGGSLTLGGIQPIGSAPRGLEVAAGALCGLFLTPIFESILLWGLERSTINNESVDTAAVPDATLTESGEVTPNERPR